MNLYKWYIQFPGGDYEQFYPVHGPIIWLFNEVKGVFNVEELDTELTVTGDIFERLYEIEKSANQCNKVNLKLESKCQCSTGNFVERWSGFFPFRTGNWSPGHGKVKFKPRTYTDVYDLTSVWDRSINLLSLPQVRVRTYEELNFKIHYFADYNVPVDVNSYPYAVIVGNYAGTFSGVYGFPTESTVNIFATLEYTGNGTPAGPDWELVNGKYYKRPFTVDRFESSVTYFHEHLPQIDEDVTTDQTKLVVNFDRPNGVLLSDYLIEIFSGFNVISNLFNLNPDGTAPVNESYQFAEDYLHDAVIFRESTIANHTASNPATRLDVVSGEFLEDLIQANIEIWYDPGTDAIRLEHVSYTLYKKGVDLTAAYPQKMKDFWEYKYIDEDSPVAEIFKYGRSQKSQTISYSPECATLEEPIDITFNVINGDFAEIYGNKAYAESGGIMLVAQDSNGVMYNQSFSETLSTPTLDPFTNWLFEDFIYQYDVLNTPFSIGNFVAGLLYWERPFLQGTVTKTNFFKDVNTEEVTMRTMRPLKSQGPLKLPVTCGDYTKFHFLQQFKTGLGWSRVVTAKYDESKSTLELTLKK